MTSHNKMVNSTLPEGVELGDNGSGLTIASTKRGPGRPKKTILQSNRAKSSDNQDNDHGLMIKSPKRGPGRPPKKTVIHEGLELGDNGSGLLVMSTKRGPGRPKKTIAQHGVELSNNQEDGSGPTTKSIKRGPGRPKKSTLQPVQPNVVELSINHDNDYGTMIKSTKRRPGRPKKSTLQPAGVMLSRDQENAMNFKQVKEEPTDHELCELLPVIELCKMEFKRESETHLNQEHGGEEASSNYEMMKNKTVPVQITPGSHVCPYCTVSFRDLTFLQQHVNCLHREEHNDTVRRKSSRRAKTLKREIEPFIIEDYEEEEAPVNNEPVPEQTTSDSHPCPYCTMGFSDPTFLRHHMQYQHPDEYIDAVRQLSSKLQIKKEPRYKCLQCDSAFDTRVQLSVHKNKAHLTAPPKKQHTCPVCARSFDYLKNLRNHCRSWHDMTVHMHNGHLRCSNCRRSFKKSWGQGPHQCVGRKTKVKFAHRNYTKPLSHVVGVNCEVCGKRVSNLHNLKKHMLVHTNEKPYDCKECGKAFRDASSLRKHMFIHTGIKDFECEVCKKRFARAGHLRIHMVMHTGEKAFSCNECGKTFSYRTDLKRHTEKMHLQRSEESYECSECGKLFSSKQYLNRHMTTHFKTLQCGDCGLKVATAAVLKIHMRKHTGERPYQCKECGKNFKRKGHLLNHHRTHTGEKPYKCDHCEAGFAQSGDLVKHKRIHTGEKPFVCTICNKAFSVKSELVRHGALHSDERRFKCEECGLDFRWRSGLNSHKRDIHIGERPYQCLNCDSCFKRSEHLKTHYRRCLRRKKTRKPK